MLSPYLPLRRYALLFVLSVSGIHQFKTALGYLPLLRFELLDKSQFLSVLVSKPLNWINLSLSLLLRSYYLPSPNFCQINLVLLLKLLASLIVLLLRDDQIALRIFRILEGFKLRFLCIVVCIFFKLRNGIARLNCCRRIPNSSRVISSLLNLIG